VLADILLKFQAQLHQLMPNAMVQLSKCIWTVMSFREIPSADSFTKRYELHFQLRKIEVDGAEVQEQYGWLNFHAKCGGQRAKLTIAVKNKWSGAWTEAWFYCEVYLLCVPSPRRGKGVYALRSYMSTLDFVTEPPFECSDDDAGDAAFVKATHFIGGRDIVEEFMAYGLYPLSASFGLGEIVDRETPVSMLHLLLPELPIMRLPNEMNDHFYVRVELTVENIVRGGGGGYAHGEHDVRASWHDVWSPLGARLRS
jgi:hypothetical protein